MTIGSLPQILVELVRQERFGQLTEKELEAAGQNMNLLVLITFLKRVPFPLQSRGSTLDCRIPVRWKSPGQYQSEFSVSLKRLQEPGRYLLLPDSLVCSQFSGCISIETPEPEDDNNAMDDEYTESRDVVYSSQKSQLAFLKNPNFSPARRH